MFQTEVVDKIKKNMLISP